MAVNRRFTGARPDGAAPLRIHSTDRWSGAWFTSRALTLFRQAGNVTPPVENNRDIEPLAKRNNKIPDFEAALAELEALVEKMEQGDLSLDESLQQFERGVQLTRSCQQALKDAEQKVQVLLEKEGQASLEPFEDDATD
jgi:exodeoxyribonuclease VII small subunit